MKWGHSWLWRLSHQAFGGPAFQWLDTCLLMGSREIISLFVLLASATFAFIMKLSLPRSTSFTFYFSPHPQGERSEIKGGWVLDLLAGFDPPHPISEGIPQNQP